MGGKNVVKVTQKIKNENLNNCHHNRKPMQYYKSAGQNNEYFITLLVPSDACTNLERKNVINSKYAKYRCSKAFVVDIEHKETKEKKDCVQSNYFAGFVYKVGDVITELSFDCDLEKVCVRGIHFFKTKQQALMYGNSKEGEYKSWYENGQLCIECVYKNGKREGKYKWWYKNGQLLEEHVYKEDECKQWKKT